MDVTFWGVRGSIPTPGPETNRYGGNTSCLSVKTAAGALLILDMGTGAVALGRTLMADGFGKGTGEASIFLSHAHWDHIQGFPFFPPVFVPGNKLAIYGQASSPTMLEGILEGQMNPQFSPLHTLKNLGATIDIHPVPDGAFPVAGLTVRALANPHGTTTALAVRLEENGRVFVYAPDAGYPEGGPTAEMLALYKNADVLVHDATYTPEDRAARLSRGFSSYEDAAKAAIAARVKKLVLFHYDQDYGDDFVDEVVRRTRAFLDAHGGQAIELLGAREGLVLTI